MGGEPIIMHCKELENVEGVQERTSGSNVPFNLRIIPIESSYQPPA